MFNPVEHLSGSGEAKKGPRLQGRNGFIYDINYRYHYHYRIYHNMCVLTMSIFRENMLIRRFFRRAREVRHVL